MMEMEERNESTISMVFTCDRILLVFFGARKCRAARRSNAGVAVSVDGCPFDIDRLLHTFRLNAGISTTAEPLGGWEAPDCEVRGHCTGHYLTACAMMYASTGDVRMKEKVDRLVAGLAECQASLTNGYLSAYPETFIDRVERSERVWAPYYTLHKIYQGLIDAYTYCDNEQALDVCVKFAEWLKRRCDNLDDDQMERMLGNEHGGMNEVLANLYAVTKDSRWIELSYRFNHHHVLDPLAANRDELTGLHANTQFPKILGVIRQYQLTGDEVGRKTAEFFWNTVVNNRTYVNGGNSDYEMFSDPTRLSDALGRNTTETCNSYNMLRMTREMFCIEPQVKYADYYERTLYNHILASLNPENGMFIYYSKLRTGSVEEWSGETDSFWCCVGTGMESPAKMNDSIYFHSVDNQTLYVNLFAASRLNWKSRDVSILQETNFPETSNTKLSVSCKNPTRFTMKIRRPSWVQDSEIDVKVNDESNDHVQIIDGWTVIDREWLDGDSIEIVMPFSLRTEGFKDCPQRIAIFDGPILLCATGDGISPDKAFPVIVTDLVSLDEKTLCNMLQKSADQTLVYETVNDEFRSPLYEKPLHLRFEPMFHKNEKPYQVFFDLVNSSEFEQSKETYAAEIERERFLSERTIDVVEIGDEISDGEHDFRRENAFWGQYDGHSYIHAFNGWFSWRMKLKRDLPASLMLTFWGSDVDRVFDVLVDDQKVATIHLNRQHPDQFFDEIIPLEQNITKDKDSVTVRLQNVDGSTVGGLFGIRMLLGE